MITNLQYTFHKILLTFFTYFTTIHTHALYMKDSEIHKVRKLKNISIFMAGVKLTMKAGVITLFK